METEPLDITEFRLMHKQINFYTEYSDKYTRPGSTDNHLIEFTAEIPELVKTGFVY